MRPTSVYDATMPDPETPDEVAAAASLEHVIDSGLSDDAEVLVHQYGASWAAERDGRVVLVHHSFGRWRAAAFEGGLCVDADDVKSTVGADDDYTRAVALAREML